MVLRQVAEIRDPVHGYVKMTEVERELTDSPFVQRLRRIHQLAGSYLVYPGAVHTRFEHVIGAMHVAGQIAESLASASYVDSDEVQEVRLAALLHDVGHGPFSHMYEEVLADKTDMTHEDISQRVIMETSVGDVLGKHGFSRRKMSALAVGKQGSRPSYMNEIIAGSLSADMMDYLLRDSYFTGVEYGKVDIHRVIHSLRVAGQHLALDDAALYAYEALLIARYEMFKAVYFHRTVRAAELMLVHSMQLADEALHLTDLSEIEGYLELTDEVVLHRLTSLKPTNPGLKQARSLATDFRDRRLVKCVFERLVQGKERAVEQLFEKSVTRDRLVSDLAERAGVDKMHIYLDVPTTPSVPYTSSREALDSVRLSSNDGKKDAYRTIQIGDLPLAGSIAGFMDMIRIYTRQEDRDSVGKATLGLFADKGYAARIPV